MNARTALTLLAVALGLTGCAETRMTPKRFDSLAGRIAELQEGGSLQEAADLAAEALADHGATLSPDQRRSLEYEIERSRRIRMDYDTTEDELIRSFDGWMTGFKPEEFNTWDARGWFDSKVIDGEKRYVGTSRSNLLFRHPELRHRRAEQPRGEWNRFIWEEYQRVRDSWNGPAPVTVGERDFELTMTIRVKGGEVAEGETIRCWMPYPQVFSAQDGVELLEASPEPEWINPPDYPVRSLYFEQPSRGTEETVFGARYRMTGHPRLSRVDPDLVRPVQPGEPTRADFYAREQPPHVVFTDEILRVAEEVGGDEENPYLRARKYYDWVRINHRYSYAREYCTLRNIPMYVLENGYGDCGQLTLLFMTLCRASGIPARWQSGWIIYPMLVNLHDWCEIYVEPYGWIPVDVNYGLHMTHEREPLTEAQAEELIDFYFGGLDAFRMIANRDHGYPHQPLMQGFRADNVDFQRGELEAGGKGLYFNQWRREMEVRHLWQEGDGEKP